MCGAALLCLEGGLGVIVSTTCDCHQFLIFIVVTEFDNYVTLQDHLCKRMCVCVLSSVEGLMAEKSRKYKDTTWPLLSVVSQPSP